MMIEQCGQTSLTEILNIVKYKGLNHFSQLYALVQMFKKGILKYTLELIC